jgi:hypothetical protein
MRYHFEKFPRSAETSVNPSSFSQEGDEAGRLTSKAVQREVLQRPDPICVFVQSVFVYRKCSAAGGAGEVRGGSIEDWEMFLIPKHTTFFYEEVSSHG